MAANTSLTGMEVYVDLGRADRRRCGDRPQERRRRQARSPHRRPAEEAGQRELRPNGPRPPWVQKERDTLASLEEQLATVRGILDALLAGK